jgi:AraC family transcriptional regulator, regulatory protein of adaptative response / methylated-DNA-[protein]-cysteine methyltransferase
MTDAVTELPETTANAYHYRVIARAIAELDAAGGERLALPDLAARLGMSPAHFQRVFSQWVGVSPKRYQQYLALGHARRLLSERFTVLEAALGAGLSGPGRLHDLFLRWEAMTPGDYARAGEGLQIAFGRFETPFGPAIAMGTDRGLCGLGFAAETGEAAAFDDLARRWPKAGFTEAPERVRPWVEAAFGGGSGQVAARLHLIGAPFQIKVWEALLSVPSGHVTSYSQLAAAVGNPRAVRAVGTAVGRNPVSFLIPCHRAIAKSGALGGYHWGLPVKRAMLAWEAARLEAGALDERRLSMDRTGK